MLHRRFVIGLFFSLVVVVVVVVINDAPFRNVECQQICTYMSLAWASFLRIWVPDDSFFNYFDCIRSRHFFQVFVFFVTSFTLQPSSWEVSPSASLNNVGRTCARYILISCSSSWHTMWHDLIPPGINNTILYFWWNIVWYDVVLHFEV